MHKTSRTCVCIDLLLCPNRFELPARTPNRFLRFSVDTSWRHPRVCIISRRAAKICATSPRFQSTAALLLQHLRHLLWHLTKDSSWTCAKSLGCLQLGIAVVGTALYELEHQSQHHKPRMSHSPHGGIRRLVIRSSAEAQAQVVTRAARSFRA